ncbi:MAG: LysM peptidoglycan-binding domain-containing protein [Planctomycetes bacterium]|nr:LysM peptidoglycan-binding domain-containing protein [Planctomycetota bacterium]
MKPAKATLTNLDGSGVPEAVQFNPPELALERRAGRAGAEGAERLSVELFFDRTLTGGSVREDLDRFYAGLGAGRDGRGARCRFAWGPDLEFTGRVETAAARVLWFDADGTPQRATLRLALRGSAARPGPGPEAGGTGTGGEGSAAAGTRRRVVRAGETLLSIAAEEYRDARGWRRLAEHNRLDDPWELAAGAVLEIPPAGGRP